VRVCLLVAVGCGGCWLIIAIIVVVVVGGGGGGGGGVTPRVCSG